MQAINWVPRQIDREYDLNRFSLRLNRVAVPFWAA